MSNDRAPPSALDTLKSVYDELEKQSQSRGRTMEVHGQLGFFLREVLKSKSEKQKREFIGDYSKNIEASVAQLSGHLFPGADETRPALDRILPALQALKSEYNVRQENAPSTQPAPSEPKPKKRSFFENLKCVLLISNKEEGRKTIGGVRNVTIQAEPGTRMEAVATTAKQAGLKVLHSSKDAVLIGIPHGARTLKNAVQGLVKSGINLLMRPKEKNQQHNRKQQP